MNKEKFIYYVVFTDDVFCEDVKEPYEDKKEAIERARFIKKHYSQFYFDVKVIQVKEIDF